MFYRFARHCGISLMLLLTLAAAGCVAREPTFINERFAANPSPTITLMPAIDARVDKSGHSIKDLQRVVLPSIERQLRRRKYTVVRANYAGSPSDEALAEMTDQELAQLGPGNGGPMLIFFLHDINVNFMLIAKTVKYEARAVLLDPETNAVLWEDREAGSFGQGGLASGFVPMGNSAIKGCAEMMMYSMPKRRSR